MRRNLKSHEAEYLEIGVEPAHVLTVTHAQIQELHVHYLGDTTVVETYGPRITKHWAFDEVMEPEEVLAEFESR